MQQRLRIKHISTLQQRLAMFAEHAKEQASSLPNGPEKDAALQRARQADNAAQMNDWISIPGSRAS
jgi:hypothetical protein